MASVEKGFALYEVDGGAVGTTGDAIVVCTTREECEGFQKNQAVLRRYGHFTAVEEVDILVHRDAMGASCHILKETSGFILDDLDVKRLVRRQTA